MPATEKRTVSLPVQQSQYIDKLVDSGAYASVSEVVRAGLRALEERDTIVEHWLRNDVLQSYKELQADPSRAIPAEKVFAGIRDQLAQRRKKIA
ncbi:type II toxin-antitoxin system ParD family antitoxin [Granulicella mallensis]|jgi:antitoxin ParD1/3/4|uniref:Antitoxin ParD1/3/4 n=1 Tax=Granulicella mallensis TaxID=940614 RepID=A0A7W7ZPM8_9BACT|nr:type II toxin-antitoxin system ParD family antitoxin [Granulicella mallensis]MBB5063449.1 antitoxin ParD1/3/4 [Granulicella mallensis]